MRYVWWGVLTVVIAATVGFVWWFGWGQYPSGPPETVVREFLQAAQARRWGRAQAFMTQHMRGRLSREGFDAMDRYLEARLEPFDTFEIVRMMPRGDETDVIVRLLLPISEQQTAGPARAGMHGTPGRVEGNHFVHAHRFVLQREGLGAWRIYQFEEVDERI